MRVGTNLRVLDANGLTPLPQDRAPFSGGARKVYRLTDGRWAFVSVNGTLFISPPTCVSVRNAKTGKKRLLHEPESPIVRARPVA